MARYLFSTVFLIFLYYGCQHSTEPNDGIKTLHATFTITDTTGKPATQFHTGESFYLFSSITNTTKDTVLYRSRASFIDYFLYKNDTIVTGSDWGCFIEIAIIPLDTFYLNPGQSLSYYWKAPTPICRQTFTALSPGLYQAKITHPEFINTTIDSIPSLSFKIIP